MKQNIVLTLIISILLIFTISVVFAYKEEIKESSEELFTKYFQDKINNEEFNQKDFNKFSELSITDKFIQASKLQQEREQQTQTEKDATDSEAAE